MERKECTLQKSLLVTDFDRCAVDYEGTDRDMLSIPLMRFTEEHEFDGWYGCTHRSYSNMSFVLNYAKNHLDEDRKNSDKYITTTVTDNFTKRTELPCLAVSTFDDTMSGKQCGQGYEDIIKPYEEAHQKPKEYANFLRFVCFNLHDKNKQLTQIAQHASNKFPAQKITLHYVDDNQDIIKNAFKVTKDKDWPTSVELKFFWHSAKGDKSTITEVKNSNDLKRITKKNQEPYLMQDHTLEIPLQASNLDYKTRLLELGVHQRLLQADDLDFALIYQRLRFAMNRNFFKMRLQCTKEWQLQALSGIEPKEQNLKDNWGATPVHYLAWSGNLTNTKKIKYKDLELKDRSDRTPIHYSAWSSNLETLDWINTNFRKTLKIKDITGLTPIHYAAWFGNPKTLDWIKTNYRKYLTKKDNYGRTPIHLAAWSGDPMMLDWIKINCPKVLEKKDKFGRTPLHYAALSSNPPALDWIQTNYPKALKSRDKKGRTPIHLALSFGNIEILNWVISNYPEGLKKMDDRKATPIHYIAASGNALALNQALSCKTNQDLWTLCKPIDRFTNKIIIKTLMEALETNTTLSFIMQNSFPIPEQEKLAICQSLLRNLTIKHSLMRFTAFVQGLSQENSVVSCLLRGSQETCDLILAYLLKEEVPPEKSNDIIFPKVMDQFRTKSIYSNYNNQFLFKPSTRTDVRDNDKEQNYKVFDCI